MGTAMDLLLASEKTVFTIDSSLRTITIPANVKNLGVASDDDVLRVYFTMPKTYCETDLSTFSIRINYLNAKGEPDLYKVTDATVEDDSIIFSWLIGRNAAAYEGNITFNICLKKIGADDIVEKEFNTTVASLPILKGLETSEAVIQNNADYIVQLERQLSEQIENTVNEWCGEKLDETAMAQSVLNKVSEDYVSKTGGEVEGPLRMNGSAVTYYNVASISIMTQNPQGAFCLTFPNLSKMYSGEVDIWSYNTSIKVIFGGYPYISGGTWVDPTATVISNNTQEIPVKYGKNTNGEYCIIIGDTGTVWPGLPHVVVSRVTVGYDAHGTNDLSCTIKHITSLDDYTIQTSITNNVALAKTIIPIEKGGTGATSASVALANLGGRPSYKTEFEPASEGWYRIGYVTHDPSIGISSAFYARIGIDGNYATSPPTGTTVELNCTYDHCYLHLTGLAGETPTHINAVRVSKWASAKNKCYVDVYYTKSSANAVIVTIDTDATFVMEDHSIVTDTSDYFETTTLDIKKENLPATKKELADASPDTKEVVDDSVSYVKDVPATSADYAKIHKIGGVTRKTKNLFDTAPIGTKTFVGLTYTTEGSYVKINGTKTSGANVHIMTAPNITLPAGTYTVSVRMVSGTITGIEESGGVFFGINQNTYGQRTTPGVAKVGDVGVRTITLSEPTLITSFDIAPDYASVGAVFDNAVFACQFEQADTATEYEPYFDGLRSAPVTEVESIGVNLIPYPYADTTKTQAGVTFTDNGDGSVTVSGTATANATFTYANSFALKHGQTYILSADVILAYKDASDSTKYESGDFVWDDSYTFVRLYSQVLSGATASKTIYPTLNKGTEALSYRPYTRNTLLIPEAVQALDGYGDGVNESVYNYIDLDAKKFVKRVAAIDLDDMVWNYTDYWASPTLRDTALINYQNPSLLAENYETHAWTGSTSGQVTMNGTGYIVVKGDSANIPHGMLYYELATPVVTDISDLLPSDNILSVEAGGTVTMRNEYGYDVPNTVTFYTDPNDYYIGSNGFVGDLIGTASRAVCDGNGNNIDKTYVKNQAESFVLKSTNKLWRITVDDSGTITATEVT